MKEMTDTLRTELRKLQKNRRLSEMADRFYHILEEGDAGDMLTGCCYWNLSDGYAMMRKGGDEYRNHMHFADFLDHLPKQYLFWCVCDATQLCTLEMNGYGTFWRELYRKAVAENQDTADIESIVFESHRAAFAVNSKVRIPEDEVLTINKNFLDFLTRVVHCENTDFYRLIYASLYLLNFGEMSSDFLKLCHGFLPKLKMKDIPRAFIAGEWNAQNAQRSERNKAQVVLNSAVNALIDTSHKKMAKELYHTAKEYGMLSNTYIDRRL